MQMIKYSQMMEDINWLVDFLEGYNVNPKNLSYFEADYFAAGNFVNNYQAGKDISQDNNGRYALGGLHEMYKWIKNVCECDEFEVLLPHMEMLSRSAVRINAHTKLINPVTNNQDHDTNKLIETIVAMFAIKKCKNIDLDDPNSSSGGANPDVIFDYCEKRVSIACKTLRGDNSKTIMDNFMSGVKQINRAECDFGYVAINAMNIIPHDDIAEEIFENHMIPLKILDSKVKTLFNQFRSENKEEFEEIFISTKVRPLILTFAHSSTKIKSDLGTLSTMLKVTSAFELFIGGAQHIDLQLANDINDFIHNLS
ncbi:MAG: hypothetical protein KDI92_12070 [Xanthomonadales bacterium]|nr:hypothetical protein [Xanthomonadales bacterium]